MSFFFAIYQGNNLVIIETFSPLLLPKRNNELLCRGCSSYLYGGYEDKTKADPKKEAKHVEARER